MAALAKLQRATHLAEIERTLGDPVLQQTIRTRQDNRRDLQRQAAAELPDWEAWKEAVAELRSHTLAHLDAYLEEFVDNLERRGGQAYFAADAAEACDYVVSLASAKGASLIVKSKSMLSEEIRLNAALEAAGVQAIETDLGEFIIQLAHERPFHILGPASHKTLEQICALFHELTPEHLPPEPQALAAFARRYLREKFLSAQIGITGCNFAVASEGAIVLVTNEGNGRLCSTLPPTHVVLMGIERLVPDLSGLEPLLTVLPRSANGLRATTYMQIISGPRRSDREDGPRELHVVIVDNGRSRILGSSYRPILRCIRCGACLDNCPVYRSIGGHAYGPVYSGPIGAVLTPLLEGLDLYGHLPSASTLCGACDDVCSARIPLTDLLLDLRRDVVAKRLSARGWELGMRGFAEITRHPNLWSGAVRLAHLALRPWVRAGFIRRGLGPLHRWTAGRDFPAVPPRSFRALWRRGANTSEREAD